MKLGNWDERISVGIGLGNIRVVEQLISQAVLTLQEVQPLRYKARV